MLLARWRHSGAKRCIDLAWGDSGAGTNFWPAEAARQVRRMRNFGIFGPQNSGEYLVFLAHTAGAGLRD